MDVSWRFEGLCYCIVLSWVCTGKMDDVLAYLLSIPSAGVYGSAYGHATYNDTLKLFVIKTPFLPLYLEMCPNRDTWRRNANVS